MPRTLYKFQDLQAVAEDDGSYTCRRGEDIIIRSGSWREMLCSFFGSAQMQAERRMKKLDEERSHGRESDMCDVGSPGCCPPAVGSDCR